MTKLSSQDLIECVKTPSTLKKLTLKQWNDVVAVLRAEKMLARVYLLMCQHSLEDIIPAPALKHFINAKKIADKQALIAHQETIQLISSLEEKAKYIVFLKGAAYSFAKSPAALGRVYSDIDVVVPRESLQSIERFLTVFGWYSEELDDYDEQYYRKWAHEIPPMRHSARGTVLDIHHNLVPVVSGRHIDIESFIEKYSEKVDEITVLCEPAKFFHSAIHLFFNEDMTSAYRDMTDLYLMTNTQDDSFYYTLLFIIEEFGFEKECMLALYFLHERYDSQFPSFIASKINVFRGQISTWELKLLSRLIEPQHKFLAEGESSIYQFIGEIRGHALKMPMPILAFHILMKGGRFVAQALFGKYVFAKEDLQ